MRIFAWDDFNSPGILGSIKSALANNSHVRVMSKSKLFARKTKPGDGIGLYTPPEGCEDTILVLHNNSDGFGQNIETEGSYGSMDGALGANSSVAASLLRQREDLLDFIVERKD